MESLVVLHLEQLATARFYTRSAEGENRDACQRDNSENKNRLRGVCHIFTFD